MSMALPIVWALDEALEIIRALQPETRKYHYHLCLGGGVLNKGRSDKDLDLYFLPMGGKNSDPVGLDKWLQSLWGQGEEIGGMDPHTGRFYSDEPPYLKRQKFMYGKLRIDVFVLGVEDGTQPRIASGLDEPNVNAERDNFWDNIVRAEEPQFRPRYQDYAGANAGYLGVNRDNNPVPGVQPPEAADNGFRIARVPVQANPQLPNNRWGFVGRAQPFGGADNNNWIRNWLDQPAGNARIDGIAIDEGPEPIPAAPPVPADEDR